MKEWAIFTVLLWLLFTGLEAWLFDWLFTGLEAGLFAGMLFVCGFFSCVRFSAIWGGSVVLAGLRGKAGFTTQ